MGVLRVFAYPYSLGLGKLNAYRDACNVKKLLRIFRRRQVLHRIYFKNVRKQIVELKKKKKQKYRINRKIFIIILYIVQRKYRFRLSIVCKRVYVCIKVYYEEIELCQAC